MRSRFVGAACPPKSKARIRGKRLVWLRATRSACPRQSRRVAWLREHLQANQKAHADWVERIAKDAGTWADENNLCSEFDRFMEEHGLPPRSREFTVEALVTITTKVSVPVSARSEEVAEGEVDGEMLARALGRRIGGFRRHDLDLREYTVTEVQA
ncbi:hypothetical protein R4282_32270 [Rhodococcus oxybenzonivorans]|uniref:hypothetical protein n=1 Tax=Rhodococcus oxybenzonivorans TaxID=1990687 RepID=UPI002953A367|nr:hypothetical protein [Rhodococcus oxybenzonivorans]MDV7357671.1 hypothetical protein [Rhodococcus oxybenzonivorans]